MSSIYSYLTFGFRKDWLDHFLANDKFLINNSLGPIQYKALIQYLKDMKLISKNKESTELVTLLKECLFRNKLDEQIIWCILWINLIFSSSLFLWWTNFKNASYTRKCLINKLLEDFGTQSFRSKINAYNALVSTLERTPIGDLLKQGKVVKKGRERIVIKEGNPDVPFLAICYNLYKFAEYHKKYEFNLEEIENMALSPQKVFSMDTKKVENILKQELHNEILQVSLSEEKPLIILNKNLSSLNMLSILIGGNHEI